MQQITKAHAKIKLFFWIKLLLYSFFFDIISYEKGFVIIVNREEKRKILRRQIFAARMGELLMNIALIAHDAKKELMTQFCIAYCGILSKHNLCATGTTGKIVESATGLDILSFLAGSQGGEEQIAARIACNEIDLLLLFRDPLTAKPNEPNEANLLRLCDVHNIPVATNIATAEALIHSLENGGLDWRDIVNPKD